MRSHSPHPHMVTQFPRPSWLIGITLSLLTTGCKPALDYLPPVPSLPTPLQRPTLSQPAQTPTTAQIEAAVRESINQVRQKNGLKPLKNYDKLADVARNYSRKMAQNNFFAHVSPDGSTLPQRVKAGGISYWLVGENLFTSTNIPQPVQVAVDGWMDSPGHRENILRPIFTETGVGVWRIQDKYYITQLFLRR